MDAEETPLCGSRSGACPQSPIGLTAPGRPGKHGISEMLQTYRPGSRTMVVAMYAEDDCSRFDPARHAGRADFVVLTDARLPRSHAYFDHDAEAG